MSINRAKNYPRIFFPDTAKEHGMVVAAVESVILDLSRTCLPGSDLYKETRSPVSIESVLKNCYFLDRNEALEAVFYLKKIKWIDIENCQWINLKQS